MWLRFNEAARKVVFIAQEEAKKHGEGYVSTEHILLGIVIEEDCKAVEIIKSLGVKPSRLRVELDGLLPHGDQASSQDMMLTPRAKRAIDLAFDEARGLNHDTIGTEHLLLGLIREEEGLAARILVKLGLTLEAARERVLYTVGLGKPKLDEPPKSAQSRTTLAAAKAWLILSARKQRMVSDQVCLMFLLESQGKAATAVQECGADANLVVTFIEEEILEVKSPGQLRAGFLGATELLVLANGEAKALDQELNGAHFLLASLVHGNNATARALEQESISVDKLRAWIVENG